MVLSLLIPSPARTAGRALLNDLKALRASLTQPLRPVAQTLHTPEQLDAFTQEARQAREARMSRAGEVLTVCEVRRPTADAVTIVFENPRDAPLVYRPGQFVTLVVAPDGEEVRRAYSMCSDPTGSNETLAVTVKRVEGGLVSNWLNAGVAVGDRIQVLGPSGEFGTTPEATRSRRVVLVAGGSGITPLFSVAQALLRGEPRSAVELVYANRSAQAVIFAEELEALEAAHAGRLRVTHVWEEAPEGWGGLVGRLSGELLERALPVDAEAEYYVCGPGPMMDGVTAFLGAAGVPEVQVRLERFTAGRGARSGARGLVHPVRFARSGRLVQVPDDQTLLEAGRAAGLPLDSSCTMGGCAACKLTVLEGEVEHEEPNCLKASEAARGACLACVARPRSALVIDA